MSARDVIEQSDEFRLACEQAMRSPLVVADHIVRDLETAGYAILSPDEMRGIRDEALEEAAAAADKYCTNENAKSSLHPAIAWSDEEKQWWQCGQLDGASAVAAAIRSLKGGRDAQ